MYEIKAHSYIVKPATEPIFSEQATIIGIDDEAGGAYLTITQHPADGEQSLRVNFDEWPHICKAVEKLRSVWEEDKSEPCL